jgi:hypothetical protein
MKKLIFPIASLLVWLAPTAIAQAPQWEHETLDPKQSSGSTDEYSIKGCDIWVAQNEQAVLQVSIESKNPKNPNGLAQTIRITPNYCSNSWGATPTPISDIWSLHGPDLFGMYYKEAAHNLPPKIWKLISEKIAHCSNPPTP